MKPNALHTCPRTRISGLRVLLCRFCVLDRHILILTQSGGLSTPFLTGTPRGNRTPKTQFLKLVCMPVPSSGYGAPPGTRTPKLLILSKEGMPNSHQGSEMVQEEGFEPPFPRRGTLFYRQAQRTVFASRCI